MEEEVIDPWIGDEADAVRAERNSRLDACDWAVLPDAPCQRDMAQRAELWLYRKALRDIPSAFESPADVVWPDAPSFL